MQCKDRRTVWLTKEIQPICFSHNFTSMEIILVSMRNLTDAARKYLIIWNVRRKNCIVLFLCTRLEQAWHYITNWGLTPSVSLGFCVNYRRKALLCIMTCFRNASPVMTCLAPKLPSFYPGILICINLWDFPCHLAFSMMMMMISFCFINWILISLYGS